MIFFKKRANNNLYRLILKLMNLKNRPHTLQEAIDYMLVIKQECLKIEMLSIHKNTAHPQHIPFGKKVHIYKKNAETTWYIIYDIDEKENIIVKKILCNHQMNKSW